MVKADVRRDYYADLGLAPSAEAEDIKKQFRKLALKYHPDRNPGKEIEFNAKFQAIQAANEILSDPQQRLKYDTDRLRAGYGKFYGPPKANTPRKAQPSSRAPTSASKSQSQKPPYSRKPQPPPNEPPPNGPSFGAQRYASHARAGPQQWHNAQDEAQTRADAFRGFQGMRGNNKTQGWQQFDPRTGRAAPSSGAAPRQNAPFGQQGPRPKSAYEYFKAPPPTASNPTSPKKKQGFAPGTAGGDEPMARGTSAYTTNHRTDRPFSYIDPEPSPMGGYSSRYAGTGGEKTFFASPKLNRSATMRTPSGSYRPSSSADHPISSSGQPGRHHSASPKDRSTRSRNISISSSSSDLDDDSESDSDEVNVGRTGAFKPKAVPKSRLRPHQKFADFHREDDSSPGEDPFPQWTPSSFAHSYSPPPPPDFSQTWRPRNPPRSWIYDALADSDDAKGHNSDSAAFPKGSYRPDQNPRFQGSSTRTDASSNTANHYFGEFGRNSPSNLHKKFSAEDWRDHLTQFTFMGQQPSDKEAFRRPTSSRNRGRASTQNGSTLPAQSPASASANPFVDTSHYPKAQPVEQPPTPFAKATFSVDQWAEQLQNLSWNVPETDKSRPSANIPHSRSPKRPPRSGVKVRSAPQPASVATEAEEVHGTANGNIPAESAHAAPADAEAMDLDDDLPPPPPLSSMPEKGPAGEPRTANYPDLPSHASKDAPTPTKKPRSQSRTEANSSSAETRAPLFDLDNLRNTAPFSSANGGIENLQEMGDTLPFQSQAKPPTTTKRDIRPRELNCPNPPKRPRAPEPAPARAGSQQLALSREQWSRYVSEMTTYMREWNQFNRRMLQHFIARQEAVETGLAPRWISAVGDSARLNLNGGDGDGDQSGISEDTDRNEDEETLVPGSGKGGFSAYLRGIEEDIQVRKHWEVACEMHRECILDLGRLREWIRNGGRVM
ncbi:Heat shock protein DnaJ N-terminal [Penicillium riverlandense]|uniref:Heat shock protein DnaJ N-terminal n=1 Tax=Penicillium riverlandense TaxID=1903569 RepID=UPI0025476326|nr:Heat shock protein DnaJ N-terminal [Penicillium riverlandense]KAJ5819197.1 Heat shock protein DnaJ N-terminal [Penicillium riverlandense]